MKGEVEMTVPEIALVLGIRATLGIGSGLLLANRLSESQRRAVGGTLLLAGIFGAIVVGSQLFGQPRRWRVSFGSEQGRSERRKSEYGREGLPPSELSMLTRETLRAGD